MVDEPEWERDSPRWEQLYRLLKDRIERGVYKPRYPIPSLLQLQEEFGLARKTVIQARARLRNEGYVKVVHGVGVFVRSPEEWGGEQG